MWLCCTAAISAATAATRARRPDAALLPSWLANWTQLTPATTEAMGFEAVTTVACGSRLAAGIEDGVDRGLQMLMAP
uniref:Uncharacterized protein n=1 Tax=Arundo donax TaxID=35708 RepID=A0A0A9AI31_ARUDO